MRRTPVRKKRKDVLQLRAPDRHRDSAELFDLLGKVFSGAGYYRFRDECREHYVNHSHYDWNVSRIGVLDGRTVTHYGVWRYWMRIGASRVRVGGIGAVATDGDCRKRGFMAQTIHATLDAMHQGGYDMTMLFGVPNFYHRFGYVRAWPGQEYVIRVEDLPKGRPGPTPRRLHAFVRDDLATMYNREYARLTGTAVRPTYRSSRRRKGQWEHYTWGDARGRTLGYVTCCRRDGKFWCYESCGEVEEALGVLAVLARRWDYREVRFHSVHYNHPLVRRLRRGTCSAEVHYRRSGGAMIRTVNLESALRRMCRELSARLRRSNLAGWRGKLLMADAREKATLVIDRSKVRVAEAQKTKHTLRGGDEVVQLLIGTDVPRETIEAAGMRLSGDARDLVEVLFPAQHPMLSPWDGY